NFRWQLDQMRERGQDQGADDRPQYRGNPAKQHHGDGVERLAHGKIGRFDIAGIEAVKCAGKGGDQVRNRESQQFVAKGVDSKRLRQILIEAYRRKIATDPRPHQQHRKDQNAGQANQREKIPGNGLLDPDDAASGEPDRRLFQNQHAQRSVGHAGPVHHHQPAQLGESERYDGKVEFLQPELEAYPTDQDRDHDDDQRRHEVAQPERNAKSPHREQRDVAADAEGGGMEHGQLPGAPEHDVESDRQNAQHEGEDEDGQDHIASHQQRQQVERNQEQQRLHFWLPNRPAGRNNRIATRNTSP